MMHFTNVLHRIYVLEDNRTEALVLKLAFSKMDNVSVEYFTSATALYERVKADAADIIVMDYLLPDAEGIDVIRTIKEKTPETRIIVVSSQEHIQAIAEAQSEEIDNFIVKSPSCVRYLHKVISDTLVLVNYYKSIKGDW